MTPIFKHLSEKQAQTYGFILASTGIQYDLIKNWLGWTVWVNDADTDTAFDILEEYIEENLEVDRLDALPYFSDRMRGYGVWGALILLGIHLAVYRTQNSNLFIQSLGASSADILQGDLFRSATALLIHASHLHLVGNMAGIALFGSAVCSVTGWGIGWLSITLAGICGNLLNALLHGSGHLSVGASTAVFGAIGILATLQCIKKIRQPGNGFRALLPLGGGLALLAMLGSGPHTDIMAHLFGLLSGGAFGLCYGIRVKRPPASRYQLLFLILTISLLIGAWTMAPLQPGFL
jgi:rhomboid protease GluP